MEAKMSRQRLSEQTWRTSRKKQAMPKCTLPEYVLISTSLFCDTHIQNELLVHFGFGQFVVAELAFVMQVFAFEKVKLLIS
jgi:hypothetical protein